jgi:hypothetical protein
VVGIGWESTEVDSGEAVSVAASGGEGFSIVVETVTAISVVDGITLVAATGRIISVVAVGDRVSVVVAAGTILSAGD